jgi:hypothetical protein
VSSFVDRSVVICRSVLLSSARLKVKSLASSEGPKLGAGWDMILLDPT